jgi:hypothetical protein
MGYNLGLLAASGVASVVPLLGSQVHGVLWTMNRSDEQSLDRFEGVEAGFYRKEMVPVGFDGRDIAALIYVATDPTPGRPRSGYLEAVIAAARSHRLPDAYLSELLGWQT